MKRTIILIFLFLIFVEVGSSFAKNGSFFVSLRADEVNMRTGPSINNPIKFTYNLKGLPMEVLDEYEVWYKVKDYEGETGWINKNLVTKKRTAIIANGTQILFRAKNLKSRPLSRIEQNVIVKINRCDEVWCKVKIENYEGWLEREGLWGSL